MNGRAVNSLQFNGINYDRNPYLLVCELVDSKVDAQACVNDSKILPLLDQNKRYKCLLLESITKNAKEFFELVKKDVVDGVLVWNENTNLLAYLLSAQRRSKGIKPFGKTKSSVELKRIVSAMFEMEKEMGDLEVLKQPVLLYGRRLKASHRGKPYLDRAEGYIALKYYLRAQLDLKIAKQYKKCDQEKLKVILGRLQECKRQAAPLEVSECVKATSSLGVVILEDSYNGSHEVSLNDELDPLSKIDYQYDSCQLPLQGPINRDSDQPVIKTREQDLVLEDEKIFCKKVEALKADFMHNQEATKCNLKPLRAVIKWLEFSHGIVGVKSNTEKNEMLVSGVLRCSPASNEEYERGSLLAFLSHENQLIALSKHYAVINVLRLIKALPKLARSDLAHACLDKDSEIGKQFVFVQGDDALNEIRRDFLDKLKGALKNDTDSKPWEKSMFSRESMPDLFPKKHKLVGAVKSQFKFF